jgi:hypothetical protein
MTDPLIAQIAQLMTSFVSSLFLKGGGELGKSMAKDAYAKAKNALQKDKWNSSLAKLGEQPGSKLCQENFENELVEELTKTNSFSKEIVLILDIMSVDAAILETVFKAYKMLKNKHDLYYTAWADSANETDEEWQKEIRNLEKKLYVLKEKVLLMLKNKKERSAPAEE